MLCVLRHAGDAWGSSRQGYATATGCVFADLYEAQDAKQPGAVTSLPTQQVACRLHEPGVARGAARLQGRAHPAAQAILPQLGSCPNTAALAREDEVTERATFLAAASSAAPAVHHSSGRVHLHCMSQGWVHVTWASAAALVACEGLHPLP